jgi:hypothetical protein
VQGVGNPLRERSVFQSPILSVDLLCGPSPDQSSQKVAALQDFCERWLLRRRAHCDLLSSPEHNSLRERSVFACFRGRYSLRERSVFCLSSCKRRPAFLPYVQGTLSERSVFPRALSPLRLLARNRLRGRLDLAKRHVLSNQGSSGPYGRKMMSHSLPGMVWIQLFSCPAGASGPK